MVDMEPRGSGNLSKAFSTRLAKSVSQRCRCFARSLRHGTSNPTSDPGFAQEVRSVPDQFEAYLQAPDTWAAEQASQLQEKPIAYFSAEFGLSENFADSRGGARSSCRRSCQISERSWAALCRYQSILSSGLLHAGDP